MVLAYPLLAAYHTAEKAVDTWTDCDQTTGNSCPQCCHVHTGAESQKNSVRTSADALISGCTAHPKRKLLFVQLTLTNMRAVVKKIGGTVKERKDFNDLFDGTISKKEKTVSLLQYHPFQSQKRQSLQLRMN